MSLHHRSVGFTVIELAIVLSVVAILATLALPSMNESMNAGRRADAINSLLQIQLLQERWRINHPSYTAVLSGANCGTVSATGLCWSGSDSADGFYTLSLSNATSSSYTLQAAPKTGSAQEGDRCGNFILTEAGPDHGTSGSADARCWKKG